MAASSRDSACNVSQTHNPMYLPRHEADPALPTEADARTLLPWTTTIAEAHLAGIVHAARAATATGTEVHDANTMMSVLATDPLPDDPWRIILLPGAATRTPTAETTLLQDQTPMPADDHPTIVLPETSHPGKVVIRESHIRLASMSEEVAAAATDDHPHVYVKTGISLSG